MTKEEIKEYISRMSVDQLRENLIDTTLLAYSMKEALDLKVAEMLLEKNRRDKETKQLKKAIQDALNIQNNILN